jgi:hypothetical protein
VDASKQNLKVIIVDRQLSVLSKEVLEVLFVDD